jgi:hypothetical protein
MKHIYKSIFFLLIFVGTMHSQNFLNAENGTTDLVEIMTPFANGSASTTADIQIVDNPFPSGINTSSKVVRYLRRTGGVGAEFFAGFFAGIVDPNPDFTINKFMHVKVLKQKVSAVRFKIEGGASADIEVGSTEPYTNSNVWQDMVFDFSAANGSYSTIVFFPDFEDPLTNTGDIFIYFDDITLNNVGTPTLSTNLPKTIENQIVVYPNPAQDVINITSTIVLKDIVIYDASGKMVAKYEDFNAENSIPIATFKSGIYWIKIKDFDENVLIKQIIKN